MNIKIWMAIGITVLLWSSAFVGIRASLEDYSPQHLALIRFSIASIIFIVISFFKKISIPEKKDMFRIFLSGFIGIAMYNFALNYGEQRIEAGVASFLVNTVPLFSALFSMYFLREKFSFYQWIGFMISFCGVLFIVIRPETNFSIGFSIFVLLFAAMTQAIMFTIQKPLTKRYSPFECTAYAIWSGTFVMVWFGAGLVNEIQEASMFNTLIIVYLGVFPAAIAYFLWAYVLSKLSVSIATTFLYLVPVGATLIAWSWLNELPTRLSIVGCLLVIAGVIIVNQKKFRERNRNVVLHDEKQCT
ncbi:DMT family transporter [Longirhabdus pacifica]|uniref:DMT family transporter n=1 Tax=Longirhabdus pacifica TaxID=2305227 RepID=UPI001008718F|nr:EamA family transporter [Longirhabdus pacifica]